MILENTFENEMIFIIMESNEMIHNLNMSVIKLEHHAIINDDTVLFNEGYNEMVTRLLEIIKKTVSKLKEWFRKVLSFISEKVSKIIEFTKNLEAFETKKSKAEKLEQIKKEQKKYEDNEKNKEALKEAMEKLNFFQNKYNEEYSEFEKNNEITVHSSKDKFEKFVIYLKRFRSSLNNYNLYGDYNTYEDVIESIISSNINGCKNLEDIKNYLKSDIVTIKPSLNLFENYSNYDYRNYDDVFSSKFQETLEEMYKECEYKLNRLRQIDIGGFNAVSKYRQCTDFYAVSVSLFTSSIMERLDTYMKIMKLKKISYSIHSKYNLEIQSLKMRVDYLKSIVK